MNCVLFIVLQRGQYGTHLFHTANLGSIDKHHDSMKNCALEIKIIQQFLGLRACSFLIHQQFSLRKSVIQLPTLSPSLELHSILTFHAPFLGISVEFLFLIPGHMMDCHHLDQCYSHLCNPPYQDEQQWHVFAVWWCLNQKSWKDLSAAASLATPADESVSPPPAMLTFFQPKALL